MEDFIAYADIIVCGRHTGSIIIHTTAYESLQNQEDV